MGNNTSARSLTESKEDAQGTPDRTLLQNSNNSKEGVVDLTTIQAPRKASDIDGTSTPLRTQSKPQVDVLTGGIMNGEAGIGDAVYYVDGQEAIVIGLDDDGDIKVRKADGSTSVWYLRKCTRAARKVCKENAQATNDWILLLNSDNDKGGVVDVTTAQSPPKASYIDGTSDPLGSQSKPQVDEFKGGILNLSGLPDINMDEEAGIGDTVYYVDGQESTLIGRDEDGDIKVRKADGSTSVWYLSKCTRAVRKVSIGEPVRYVCGEIATVEGFDEDGDIEVRKNDGKQAVWYKTKSSGLDVPVSKPISRQNSGTSLHLMGA